MAAESATLDLPAPKHHRRFAYRAQAGPVRRASEERKRATSRVVEDLSLRTFHAEWDHKLTKVITGIGLGEFRQDQIDDIKQNFYLFICQPRCPTCGKMTTQCLAHVKQHCGECGERAAYCAKHKVHRSRGLTGLQLYDPRKGSLSVYVYWAINVAALNYRAKMRRDHLQLSPKGIDPEPTDRRSKTRGDFWIQIDRVRRFLDDEVGDDVEGFFDEGGRYITRDLRTLIDLILEDRTVKDIAQALRCTVVEVEGMLGALREREDVRALLQRSDEDD